MFVDNYFKLSKGENQAQFIIKQVVNTLLLLSLHLN